MNISIEIISRETIKPSSPTPLHLQNYRLSFIDQITPPIYNVSVFFYESSPNITNAEKSNQLKASLSKSLTHYYPLAGRLVNNESIHCNDEGVSYIEAHARSTELLKVIPDPSIGEFDKFLPRAIHEFYDNVLLAIQVSFFDCGGLAIGVCVSHKLADATSTMMFLNGWAATLRDAHGDSILNRPIFESAMHFPPRDQSLFSHYIPVVEDQPVVKDHKENIVSKVFLFSSSMLEILRAKFSDEVNKEGSIRATRVEALTAFLSNKYVTVITKASKKAPKKYLSVVHAVSMRSRMEPPLSKYHFGNYSVPALANSSIEEVEGGCRGEFVRNMRGAINGINAKYVVDNLRESNMFLDHYNLVRGKVISGDGLNFSSWCRMGAYEVDFGWGKPLRVGLTSGLKNFVRFVDGKDEGAIEAWIHMEEEDMAKLEADPDFLSYI